MRILPEHTAENTFFWTSGADGRLRFLRCSACGHIAHPPVPVCARCLTRSLEPAPVSGRGVVVSCTVSHQPFPGFDPPYAVALVAIEEQPDVRLLTNIVACPPEDVRIGLPVRVVFEHQGDTWLPLFEPAEP